MCQNRGGRTGEQGARGGRQPAPGGRTVGREQGAPGPPPAARDAGRFLRSRKATDEGVYFNGKGASFFFYSDENGGIISPDSITPIK